MAIYAVDEDDLIHASDAKPGKIYWCEECFGPVKIRRGRWRLSHFYHLKAAPSCRLYSKTEDHLLAQLQLQKIFPPEIIQLEKPFLKINRVADAVWEKEKIIFEVQCSPITEKEAEMRIRDYRTIGYEAIWLLDDKRYNKRVIRPGEAYLRTQSTYYYSIRNQRIYDQFEVFSEGRRVRRGKQLEIDLQRILWNPKKTFTPDLFPKQILDLAVNRYFFGDRLSRALQNHHLTMAHWRRLEFEAKRRTTVHWFRRYFIEPYARFIGYLIRRAESRRRGYY